MKSNKCPVDLSFKHVECVLKGIVHPKNKILSSFTPPRVVPNLYECICSDECKGRYSEEWGKQSSFEFLFCPKTACYKLSSKYLPLCSAEQIHSYKFGIPWGGANDDRIFFFLVNYSFKVYSTSTFQNFNIFIFFGGCFSGELVTLQNYEQRKLSKCS